MKFDVEISRRHAIASAIAVIGVSAASLVGQPAHAAETRSGESATETLLTEHGILSRCLLIYEELARRVRNVDDMPMDAFESAATVVRTLIEDVHEKHEEALIFPVLAGTPLAAIAQTLTRQHRAGRAVTDRILSLSAQFQYPNNQQKVIALSDGYVRMMRPHAAREATVLFPAYRRAASAEAAAAAARETALDSALTAKSLSQVEAIEKQLGIYELAALTATVPPD